MTIPSSSFSHTRNRTLDTVILKVTRNIPQCVPFKFVIQLRCQPQLFECALRCSSPQTKFKIYRAPFFQNNPGKVLGFVLPSCCYSDIRKVFSMAEANTVHTIIWLVHQDVRFVCHWSKQLPILTWRFYHLLCLLWSFYIPHQWNSALSG